jgi:hypothetical protein
MGRPLPSEWQSTPVIGPIVDWLNNICEAIQDNIVYWIYKVWDWIYDRVKDVWNYVIKPALRDVIDAIWDIWVKFKTWVKDAVKDIWNDVIKPIIDTIASGVNWLKDEMWNKLLKPAIDAISSGVNWLKENLWDKFIKPGIDNILSKIGDAYKFLTVDIPNKINDLWEKVKPKIDDIISKAKDLASSLNTTKESIIKKVEDGVKGIGAMFDGAVSDITKTFTSVVDFFKDPWGKMKKGFEEAGKIILGGVDWAKKAWGDFINIIASPIIKMFMDLAGGIIAAWGSLISTHVKVRSMPKVVFSSSKEKQGNDPEVYIPREWSESVITIFDPLRLALEAIVDEIGSKLKEIVTVEGPITSDKAKENMEKFIGLIKDININISELDIITECLSLGQVEVIGRVLQNLAWTYGLGWLQWVALGPGLKYAIAQPLEDYYTYVTRPNRITRSDVEEAYRKGYITREVYRDRLARLGYKDEDIDIMEKIAYKEMTLAEVRRLIELGVITEDEARDKLAKMGYRSEDIDLVLKYITFEQTEEERRLAKSDIISAFSEGVLTEDQAKEALLNLGYTADAADILLATAKKKLVQAKRLTASQILAALRERTIDTKEADQLLAELGFEEKDREILIKTELAKTVVTPRLPTASMILEAFRFNVINEEGARTWLETLKYDKPTIDLLINTEKARIAEIEARELKKQRLPTASQIGRAYIDGVISRDEMKKRLIELDYSEADAELICLIYDREKAAALQRIRKPPPEKKQTLSASQILEAYREGVFSGEEALTRLEGLGYSTEDALVLLEVQRRTLTPSQIIRAMRRGIITEDQARERLSLQGYTSDDIDILMELGG